MNLNSLENWNGDEKKSEKLMWNVKTYGLHNYRTMWCVFYKIVKSNNNTLTLATRRSRLDEIEFWIFNSFLRIRDQPRFSRKWNEKFSSNKIQNGLLTNFHENKNNGKENGKKRKSVHEEEAKLNVLLCQVMFSRWFY